MPAKLKNGLRNAQEMEIKQVQFYKKVDYYELHKTEIA
jgi:hypothetical protein